MSIDRWALEDLYSDYARLLDDGPLEQWPDLFTESCLYLAIPRDNFDAGLPLATLRCESRGMLMDRVRAVQETIMFEPRYLRHQITQITPRVQPRVPPRAQPREQPDALPEPRVLEDGKLEVTAHYTVIEVLHDELPRILSVGRYLDVVTNEDGRLKFAEKRAVYDSVLVPNTIVYPL